jgi:hypothetical protein
MVTNASAELHVSRVRPSDATHCRVRVWALLVIEHANSSVGRTSQRCSATGSSAAAIVASRMLDTSTRRITDESPSGIPRHLHSDTSADTVRNSETPPLPRPGRHRPPFFASSLSLGGSSPQILPHPATGLNVLHTVLKFRSLRSSQAARDGPIAEGG